MTVYERLRPLVFRFPPERAHRLSQAALKLVQETPLRRGLKTTLSVSDDRLATTVFGHRFPNPVGVAAGYDKSAEIPRGLSALGFGFVEVGGVTARPQDGNPRPRLFRLPEDNGLVNRLGLNNDGAAAVGERVAAADTRVPIGVNLAKGESVPLEAAAADYRQTYQAVTAGDFFVVNVSCPNSQGFEALQTRSALTDILGTLADAGARPLLVKLSPDLPPPAVDDALAVVRELGLDGVVATNTTTDRPASLRSPVAAETGGLSGQPLEERATEMVRYVAERVDVPVVGVGGVATAADAYRKIRAGASLVQLYTALIYRGPTVARAINRGLLRLLERDGFDTVADAVGADL